MVRVIYKTIFAMLAAIACSSTEAKVDVAYSPWQPGKDVNREVLVKELTLVARNFSVVRTFHAVMNGHSIVEVAAEVGLQIDVGIHMTDEKTIDSEIEAVCVAYKSYGETIRTVYVGNENLLNNGFGKFPAQVIIKYIKQVQACVGINVRVGTVQRVEEWLSAPGIDEIVKVCTSCGVNIHPYFARPSSLSPIQMLQAQWDQIATKYGSMEKFAVTETGWPTDGAESYGTQTASVEIAQQYLIEVTLWSETNIVIWFMFSDSLESYNGKEIEKHFGLYDATCSVKKLELPVQTNSGNTTSSYRPSPVTSVGVPPTQQTPLTQVGGDAQVTPVTSPPTPNPVTPLGQQLELDSPATSEAKDNGQAPTPGKPVEVHDDVLKGGKPVDPTGKDCTI